jgi:putative CocE/NonD family hydrolase
MPMQEIDGARCFQAMVPMRDGARMNTFVYLPPQGGPRFPVIVHRTPYGITSPAGVDVTDPAKGWLPDPAAPMRGPIKHGWRELVEHGYAAVYQDCRGRYASEGEDHVYGDDAPDGYDTLEWIASEPWSDGNVGLSGSSAGSTTALAAASQRHPSVKAFFAQVGGSSIYDDVVYEGGSIEMERLWLWVANNIPGLSQSHREAVMARTGMTGAAFDASVARARERFKALDGARHQRPPYVDVPEWMHLPLLGYPDFADSQPYLDELLSHPAPDAFRVAHDFRATIDAPGFHVTTWFDIFLTSVLAAFQQLQARVGNQKLWIGPNDHYFVYDERYWSRDPYFEWFDHWLKGLDTPIMAEPAVCYSPRCWVDVNGYVADDWRHADTWPPPGGTTMTLHLRGDGTLDAGPGGEPRTYRYDPANPVYSLGGRNMLITAGARDQRPVQALDDYGLIYASEPLTAPLAIAGPVQVVLHASSDCPDTDFVAKLIERHPDGRAVLLMDGVVRAMFRAGTAEPEPLHPGEAVEVRIHLGDISHTFGAGGCIEVDVTSSNFPRRARNTNSGHPLLAADGPADIRVAHNTVLHDTAHPSYLVLPVAATQ